MEPTFPINFILLLWINQVACQGDEQVVTDRAPPPKDYALEEIKINSGINYTKSWCGTKDDRINNRQSLGRVVINKPNRKWKQMNIFVNYSQYNEMELMSLHWSASFLNNITKECNVSIGIWPEGHEPCGDYVHIYSEDDTATCNSKEVGRIGGVQYVQLNAPACLDPWTVVHELMHALGFYHEQSRRDRDQYIDVFYDRIMPWFIHNFDIANDSSTNDMPYNTKSLMHYHSLMFTNTGEPVMLDKKGGIVGWDGTEPMNQLDIEMIRKFHCEP